MTEITDQELVERTQAAMAGDTRAFDELVTRHQEKVLANCRYLSGSVDDAQDLAQGVFVKAYFGLKTFEGRASFGTWVKRIKVNHCLNHLRSRKNRFAVDIDAPEAEMNPELWEPPRAHRDMVNLDRRERIRTVLEAMPETLRVPLVMRDMDGMAYQEIADTLKVGLSAVKMRIKRAREHFRAEFEGSDHA